MSRTVEVTELVLRDGHQSLLATRMALEDMVAACEDIDQAGYWSVECWGGATYDSCIRFLNEDPWERLRTFRKLMPNSPPADAAARPEPARLPPLRGHASSTGSWRSRPRTAWTSSASSTRSTTSATCAGRSRPSSAPASTRRARSATPPRPLHTVEQFVEMAAAAPRPGLRLDLHQGHGGAAQAAAGLRPGQGHQGGVRRGHRWSTSTSTPRPASRWSA